MKFSNVLGFFALFKKNAAKNAFYFKLEIEGPNKIQGLLFMGYNNKGKRRNL